MATVNINLCVLITSPIVFVDVSKPNGPPPPFKAKAPSKPESTSLAAKASSSRLADAVGTYSWSSSTPTDPPEARPVRNNQSKKEDSHHDEVSTCHGELSQNDRPLSNALLDTFLVEQEEPSANECSASQSKPIFDASIETPSRRSSAIGNVEIRQSLLDSLRAEETLVDSDARLHRTTSIAHDEQHEARQVFQTPCTPRLVTVGGRAKTVDPSFSDSPTSLDSGIGMDGDSDSANLRKPSKVGTIQSEMSTPSSQWQSSGVESFESSPAFVPSSSVTHSQSPNIATDEGWLQSNPTASENEPSPEKEVLQPRSRLGAPRLCLIPATEPSTPVDPPEKHPALFSSSPVNDDQSQSPKRTAYADSFAKRGPPLNTQPEVQISGESTTMHNSNPRPHAPLLRKRPGRSRRDQAPVIIGSEASEHRPYPFAAATFPPPINPTKANALPSRGCRSSSLPQTKPETEWNRGSGLLTSSGTSPATRTQGFENPDALSSSRTQFSRYHRKSQLSSAPMLSAPLPFRRDRETENNGYYTKESPPVPEKDLRFMPKNLRPPNLKQFDPETQTPPPGSSFMNRFIPYRRGPGPVLPRNAQTSDGMSHGGQGRRFAHRHRAQSEVSFHHQQTAPHPNSGFQNRVPTDKEWKARHLVDEKIQSSGGFPRPARRLDFDSVAEQEDHGQRLPKSPVEIEAGDRSFLLSPTLPRSPISPPLPTSMSVPCANDFDDEEFLMARSFYTTPAPCKGTHARSHSDLGLVA